jgi:hypothetical protein
VTRELMPALVIPEGGDNAEGFAGCRELGRSIAALAGGWDVIAAGLRHRHHAGGRRGRQRGYVLGIAALRDAAGITARAAAHLAPTVRRFHVLDRFAGRGFARIDAELAAFMAQFTQRNGVPLDPVYTGKLFLGLHTLVGEGRFPARHSGAGAAHRRAAGCARRITGRMLLRRTPCRYNPRAFNGASEHEPIPQRRTHGPGGQRRGAGDPAAPARPAARARPARGGGTRGGEHLDPAPGEVRGREDIGRDTDLVIVVGGDGSLLGAARSLAPQNAPVLGVNRGRLGFLTDISPQQLEAQLDEVLAGAT